MFWHLIEILEEVSINYLEIIYATRGRGDMGRIEVQVNGR